MQIKCAFKPDEDYTCNVRGCVVCQLLKDKTRKEIDRLNRGRKKLDELIPKTTKQINQQLQLSLTLVDARMRVAKLLRKRQGLDEQLISIGKRLYKCNQILGLRDIETPGYIFDLTSGSIMPGLLTSPCLKPATIPTLNKKPRTHLRTLECHLRLTDIAYIKQEIYKFKNYNGICIDTAIRVFLANANTFANATHNNNAEFLVGRVIQEGKGDISPMFGKSIVSSIISTIRRNVYYYCIEHDIDTGVYTGYCPKIKSVRFSSKSEYEVRDLVADGIALHIDHKESLNSTTSTN